MKFWTYIEAREADQNNPAEGITQKEVNKIIDGTLSFKAYGAIRYSDSFDQAKVHTSRFCYYYAWAFKEFRTDLVAPAAYHECT